MKEGIVAQIAIRLFSERVKELDEADTKDFNELMQLYFVAPDETERTAAYNGIKEIILIPDGKIVHFLPSIPHHLPNGQ